MNLDTPLKEVSRSYKMYAKRLEKLGIVKLSDFLFHVPFRYDDFSLISKIDQVQAGETVTIIGKVLEIKNEYTSRWRKLQKAKISDKSGEIEVTWFNQPYLVRTIAKGDLISLSGKVGLFRSKKILQSPDFEIIYDKKKKETIHTGRLVPIYPETRGVSSKWLRRQVYNLLETNSSGLIEYLPKKTIRDNNLISFDKALSSIHFPKTIKDAEIARERLSFDELFLIQLASLKRKREWEKSKTRKPFKVASFREEIEKFLEKLSFELTDAQKRVIKEIFTDFSKNKPMNRLLEGEVGSGKTVVATIAMYLTFLNKEQSILMAPTEILATQHFKTIHSLLSPLKVKVALLTSSQKKKGNLKNTDIY